MYSNTKYGFKVKKILKENETLDYKNGDQFIKYIILFVQPLYNNIA